MTPIATTERLTIRKWHNADIPFLEDMHANEQVMQYLDSQPFDAHSTRDFLKRMTAHHATHGFGHWLVTRSNDGAPLGMTGLIAPNFQTNFTPCVEIGWRFHADHWGHGYATEAATAILHYGHTTLKIRDIYSFTVPANTRSQAVMKRIGLTRRPEHDFKHPNLPKDSPLSEHLVYCTNAGAHH